MKNFLGAYVLPVIVGAVVVISGGFIASMITKLVVQESYHCIIPDQDPTKQCRVQMRKDIYMEDLKEVNTTKSN